MEFRHRGVDMIVRTAQAGSPDSIIPANAGILARLRGGDAMPASGESLDNDVVLRSAFAGAILFGLVRRGFAVAPHMDDIVVAAHGFPRHPA